MSQEKLSRSAKFGYDSNGDALNMRQNKFDRTMMEIARSMSSMSNCAKYKVGCTITANTRIVSTGYNGTPSGYINCGDRYCFRDMATDLDARADHKKWSADHEIHAEMNAILYAAKIGIALEGATLYCTMQPCHNCLKHIIQCGIKTVIYETPHGEYTKDTLEMLLLTGVTLRKL